MVHVCPDTSTPLAPSVTVILCPLSVLLGGSILAPRQGGGVHTRWFWYGESEKSPMDPRKTHITGYSSDNLVDWKYGVLFL